MAISVARALLEERCGAFNNPQIKGKPRRVARDTNGTRHCHYYARVSWCIGGRVPVGAAGTKHNVSRGRRNQSRGRKVGEGVARARGVSPEPRCAYPRVTGRKARFKRVGNVSMKAAGITKAIREHYPESSVATLALCAKDGPGEGGGLINDARYTVLIPLFARDGWPCFSLSLSFSTHASFPCKLCNKNIYKTHDHFIMFQH